MDRVHEYIASLSSSVCFAALLRCRYWDAGSIHGQINRAQCSRKSLESVGLYGKVKPASKNILTFRNDLSNLKE